MGFIHGEPSLKTVIFPRTRIPNVKINVERTL